MDDLLSFLQPILGLAVFVLIAWLLSENRRGFNWRVAVIGIVLQFVVALVMFKIPLVQSILMLLNRGVAAISNATEAGTRLVFGYLGGNPGDVPYPFAVEDPASTYILAFRVLPLILFFSVLSAILWYYRILPLVIKGFSVALRRSMGVGGAVGVSTAANIFLGMVEAPLLIRPYLAKLTRSELFIVMTCGMATIAGAVMILYSVILKDTLDNALGHILTASVISAPAAIMVALIMIPGDKSNTPSGEVEDTLQYHGLMDAISQGTTDGIRFMVNVGAMLIVLIALVSLFNSLLSLLPDLLGAPITLQRMLGYFFAPFVWLMGIPWQECLTAGSLMGIKTVLNEFIAFMALTDLPSGELSSRSTLIMTYALCGFANFGSLGIMVAGLASMCAERRQEIVTLAPRTLISGTLATSMTACVAALLG